MSSKRSRLSSRAADNGVRTLEPFPVDFPEIGTVCARSFRTLEDLPSPPFRWPPLSEPAKGPASRRSPAGLDFRTAYFAARPKR
jgi:hypothetical protein